MHITQDIILDLWPLYEAGELSPDSNELVESYLASHPDFARQLKTVDEAMLFESASIPGELDADSQLINRIKRQLRIRSLLFFLAMVCSVLPFSFGQVSWSDRTGVHWLWMDHPHWAFGIGGIGLVLWLIYYLLNRSINRTTD